MSNFLGVVFSTQSGVVTRKINPTDDAYLDAVDKVLPPELSLYRILKADVGADDRNIPAVEALIAYANASKAPPAVPLKQASNVAIIDGANTVVDIVYGCPTLVNSHYAPRVHGIAASAVELTPQKTPSVTVSGKAVPVPVTIGATYNKQLGTFTPTAAEISAVSKPSVGPGVVG